MSGHATFDCRRKHPHQRRSLLQHHDHRPYNAHNFPLTVTDALGNQTVTTYDSHDNPTQVQQKNSPGTVLVDQLLQPTTPTDC